MPRITAQYSTKVEGSPNICNGKLFFRRYFAVPFMKYLIFLFLWLLQAPFCQIRAEHLMVPPVSNIITTGGGQTENTRQYKTARKPKKEVTELTKLRRKKAWLITAIVLLLFAISLGGLFTGVSLTLVPEGTVPSITAGTLVFGISTLLSILFLILSIRRLTKVIKAIKREKKRIK